MIIIIIIYVIITIKPCCPLTRDCVISSEKMKKRRAIDLLLTCPRVNLQSAKLGSIKGLLVWQTMRNYPKPVRFSLCISSTTL